ncbi:MAG: hypothetical protein EZS28_054935, partial [Streblomastix strix]
MATVKMNEISPESTNIARMFDDDDEDDDKLGNAEDEQGKQRMIKHYDMKFTGEWKSEYSCTMNRLDEAHKSILKSTKKLVRSTTALLNAIEQQKFGKKLKMKNNQPDRRTSLQKKDRRE